MRRDYLLGPPSDGYVYGADEYVSPAPVDPEPIGSLTGTGSAAPAGGMGAAAGAWDTAAHRDAAIATINNLKTRLDELEAILKTAQILS